jgi:hypothetical protein
MNHHIKAHFKEAVMYSKNPKGLSFDPLHSFLSLLDFDFKLRFLYYQLRFGSKSSMLKFKQK